jgi:pyruvate dehydrogenase E1 component beta subunit
MGEDIGAYGGAYVVTKGFLAEFGEKRIKDTPISESGIVGCGIGAAMAGLRPVVEIMTINFSLLAIDQIVNNAAKIHSMSGGQVNVPLIIRTVSGGGRQLAATHSQSLEGWYATVPGLYVVCPASPYDALGLFRSAMKQSNTVVFVEHSLLYPVKGEVPAEYYEVPIGKSDIKRQGKDVTIVSYLRMTQVALTAAAKLAQEGIECEVVDLRSLRPLDIGPVLESVRKTNRCVIVEEAWRTAAIGAEVAAQVYENALDHLDGEIRRVAGADVPMPYSKALEPLAIPSEQDVIGAVKAFFSS